MDLQKKLLERGTKKRTWYWKTVGEREIKGVLDGYWLHFYLVCYALLDNLSILSTKYPLEISLRGRVGMRFYVGLYLRYVPCALLKVSDNFHR